MNKRHLHHIWTKLRLVKPKYILVLTLLSLVICIFALRSNNEHMARLRSDVYVADKANANVQIPLQNLQAYVTRHMNTNLSDGPNAVYPPIQLEYTYERLALAQAEQASSANTQLYTTAQAYCEKLDPVDFSGHNRVPCIEQYVQTHGSTPLPQIPDSLYKFDFVSPRWSSDFAGWSLVVTILLGIFFIVISLTNLWFKYELSSSR